MRRYDFIFSLGAACSCSQSLRLANLQFASFPCDWLYGGAPAVRARALTQGFDGLLAEDKLVRHQVPWNLEHEPWRNVETGIVFKHDFDWNTPLAETLAGVRAKYARRQARLAELVAKSKSVLAVWLNPPSCAPFEASEYEAALQILAAHWPDVRFDLLVLQCEPNRSFSERTDERRNQMRFVSWNYDDGRAEFIDNAKMATFLSSEYSLDDYRTPEERKSWPARQRALRYAQYNAKTWMQYVTNKAWFRLYRHVRKEIERRGLQRLG